MECAPNKSLHFSFLKSIPIIFEIIKQLFVCVFVRDIFLYNHLLLCHDYPSLSSNFYHQGKTTNSISYFCVTITDVLVQTFNTRGKYKWRHSSSILTRTRKVALGATEVLVILKSCTYTEGIIPLIDLKDVKEKQILELEERPQRS